VTLGFTVWGRGAAVGLQVGHKSQVASTVSVGLPVGALTCTVEGGLPKDYNAKESPVHGGIMWTEPSSRPGSIQAWQLSS
jgi:hypothetical protein